MDNNENYEELKNHILSLLRVYEPIDIHEFMGREFLSYEVKHSLLDILVKIQEIEKK